MIKRIVVGTDGSPQAMAATRWAAELANQLDAELLIVHVFELDATKLPGGYVTLPAEELEQIGDNIQRHLDGPWSETACARRHPGRVESDRCVMDVVDLGSARRRAANSHWADSALCGPRKVRTPGAQSAPAAIAIAEPVKVKADKTVRFKPHQR